MASAADPFTPAEATADPADPPDRASLDPRFTRLQRFAGMTPLQALRELDSSLQGLDEREAQERLARDGDNALPPTPARGPLAHLMRAVLDPFVVVLVLLGVVSALTGDIPGIALIGALAAISCALRARQEYGADRAAAALRDVAATTATVLRRARPGAAAIAREVPTDQLVPGDVVRLAGGDIVPADLLLLRSDGLALSQALLTGESLPVTKHAGLTASAHTADASDVDSGANATLLDHPRLCLLGASVVGGSATAMVVATGAGTYFGLSNHDPPDRHGRSTFERGVTGVSVTLIRLILATVAAVLAVTEFSHDTWLQACLFAVAGAVGLVPGMLPVVVTTVLVRAQSALREGGIVVKRLPAVHNLGAMDVLCVDKTGTLTIDRLTVACHLDPLGRPDAEPLRLAHLNACFGLQHADAPITDAIDEALIEHAPQSGEAAADAYTARQVLGFDGTRRRATVVLRPAGQWDRELLITKGAAEHVLACCTHARIDGRDVPLDATHRQRLHALADSLHTDGVRALAVAVKTRRATSRQLRPADETALTLIGYVGLLDEAKPSTAAAFSALTGHGVRIKVLTGDHPLVAARICQDAGLDPGVPICGHEIDALDEPALAALARRTTLFARVDARQKARIVSTLRRAGHTVGYLGDGVNDAPALHAADVGASVEGAVDIVRQSSEVLLTGKDLEALTDAVAAGRHAFANIVKYVKITVSSNVGNVCSVLAAGAFLPFLPMLPLQILLQNLLFDLSQLSLAFDQTDPAARQHPRTFDTWDLNRFVLFFGAINSLADLATFAALHHIVGADISPAGQALFHTAWFVENLLTQILAVHLLRGRGGTSGWSWAARPVIITSVAVMLFSLGLAATPLGAAVGLSPPPAVYYLWLAGILTVYAFALVAAKRLYQRMFRTWL
ncbi:magnesium-translocating P-type ATPase [Dactylosporangium sp. NPDC051484]|uniref:magnesium-translocating P-type ATPase n=1 Tax=Dactylosporangium sp. NPDC051484 TaxID=3154942 RepID=UPI00344B4E93